MQSPSRRLNESFASGPKGLARLTSSRGLFRSSAFDDAASCRCASRCTASYETLRRRFRGSCGRRRAGSLAIVRSTEDSCRSADSSREQSHAALQRISAALLSRGPAITTVLVGPFEARLVPPIRLRRSARLAAAERRAARRSDWGELRRSCDVGNRPLRAPGPLDYVRTTQGFTTRRCVSNAGSSSSGCLESSS